MTHTGDTSPARVEEAQREPSGRTLCAVCGAELVEGRLACPRCKCPTVPLDVRRVAPSPLPPRSIEFAPQFDRLLVLASFLALASLYLPWVPGLSNWVPGWKLPYAAAEIPLDEIRHLENVARPESLFFLNFAGIVALIFCRTSRHAGLRDLVATVLLVAGGGYTFIYFAQQWGWSLSYNYVGPYAGFASLGLMVIAGLLRPRFMPWVPQSKVLFLVASAFLLTGLFFPWSLDSIGFRLMFVAREFYWTGVPRACAYLMLIFPVLGFAAFVTAFRQRPIGAPWFVRSWAVLFGIASLVYFRVMWASYLVGWPLGSWGILLGLTVLTAAGFLEAFPTRPFLARLLLWAFVLVSAVAWLTYAAQSFMPALHEFLSPPERFF